MKAKYKKLRLQKLEKERAKRRFWKLIVISVLLYTVGPFLWHHFASNHSLPKAPSNGKWSLATLLALKPHQLEGLDIGLANLLCAEGLRGSETLDLDKTLNRLDAMASHVRRETERNRHRFRSNPAEYENSEAYYCMSMLVTVLQQDLGLLYNPARVSPVGVIEPNSTFFADSRDVFIHGLTGKPDQEPAPPCLRVLSPLAAACNIPFPLSALKITCLSDGKIRSIASILKPRESG
jgi:hypothetical protein